MNNNRRTNILGVVGACLGLGLALDAVHWTIANDFGTGMIEFGGAIACALLPYTDMTVKDLTKTITKLEREGKTRSSNYFKVAMVFSWILVIGGLFVRILP